VRTEQLTTPSNIDVKNEWRYSTNPHIFRAQISRKSRTHLKILNVRVVTETKSHTQ